MSLSDSTWRPRLVSNVTERLNSDTMVPCRFLNCRSSWVFFVLFLRNMVESSSFMNWGDYHASLFSKEFFGSSVTTSLWYLVFCRIHNQMGYFYWPPRPF